MRIPIDLLPPIETVVGSFREMDCFACCWCIFTDCTSEQRAEIIAASRYGVNNHKIINILNRLYPEFNWNWEDYINTEPGYALEPGYAALMLYKVGEDAYHYAILMNRDGVYERYDPQSRQIHEFDCLHKEYQLLDAYIPYGRGDMHIGKLPPARIAYQSLTNKPSAQGEQNKILYEINYYIKKLKQLFIDQEQIESDIDELRHIAEFINQVNKLHLEGRDQKMSRRILNEVYMYHYRALSKWRMEDLVPLEQPRKYKHTNYYTHIKSQKPTKSKYTKSKQNSARSRKTKRKSRRPPRPVLETIHEPVNAWVNENYWRSKR